MAREIILPEGERDSSVFSGSTSGQKVRKMFNLDREDGSNEIVDIKIPSGTSYIDDAFLRGLLSKSIYNLKGLSKFNKKYHFVVLDDNGTVKNVLEGGIQKGLERLDRRR